MKCPKCGRENEKWDAYCVTCQTELKAAAYSPEPDEAPQKKAGGAAVPGGRLPLIGLLFAAAGNGFFVYLWKDDLGNRWPAFAAVTTAISAVVGYYFGRRIAATRSYGMGVLYGLLGGAIVGAVNGTGVIPGYGTVVGTGIGAVIGLVCGLVYAGIVRGYGGKN